MKTAYITFHVHNYGIGFTKNILAAFYLGKLSWNKLETNYLKQKELENAYLKSNIEKQVLFDKVFYLHVNQETVNKITSTRRMKKSDCLIRIQDDEDLKKDYNYWEHILNINNFQIECNEFESEIKEVKKISKEELIPLYWKIIHYYNFDDQKKWFNKYSNSKSIYNSNNFETINIEKKYGLNDLHDYRLICSALENFINEYDIINQFEKIVINISSVGYEVQVSWFTLAQAGRFNEKVHFISTYDNKDQDIRFKDFIIKEIPKNILEELSDKIKINEPYVVSEKRLLAEKEFKLYYNKGFSILILGERGCGKTRLIESNSSVPEEKFLSISAAAYESDSKLEAELFGYVKGAFTGADKDTKGLFHKVDKSGILFIDELHSMSKRVQEKLMSSLSTDKEGNFKFKRLGSDNIEKANFTIVFASNKSITELKNEYLLQDFYDRVVQYIITIPPLREARDDIKNDWKATWEHQKFNTKRNCPQNDKLFNWLGTLEFPGNWRDLQRIAIWYEAFSIFPQNHRNILGFDNPLDYAKHMYELICIRKDPNKNKFDFFFDQDLSATGQAEEYQKQLALWAKEMHGSFKKAAIYYNERIGDKITEKTLYNWANPEKKKKGKS